MATARVEYPWHPLRGQSLRVVQRLTKGGLDILWLEEQPGRSRVVPAWMCDAAACLGMEELGPPRIDVEALSRLTVLLSTASEWSGGASSRALPVQEASDAESSAAEIAARARPRPPSSVASPGDPPRGGAGPGRAAARGARPDTRGGRRPR
ncbi:hypothetical protein J8J14_24000 [Roseomonas sp. SSH11]|uniref:Uncharacterized protein n=1 Tax=Pararoseomonas baculiformis TaxID=2820812 RepID=A0ABS4ALA3_9PROT|nr:hypothetical protein [Pararoseomonas baculiformis]